MTCPCYFIRYGLECLFRYYSYGLEKKFRPELYKDFQAETIRDHENGINFMITYFKITIIHYKKIFCFVLGQLYGLEKFWAFLEYYKYSKTLQVDPKLKQFLNKFKTIEDFRKAEEVYKYIYIFSIILLLNVKYIILNIHNFNF